MEQAKEKPYRARHMEQAEDTFYRDRLVTLRDHLRDNVRDEQFDLDTYGGSLEKPWEGLLCNTVACSIGFATEIPEFQALGLKLENYPSDPYSAMIVYGIFEGSVAIQHFLNLPAIDVSYLFFSHTYPNADRTTRQEVIERITAFLKGERP